MNRRISPFVYCFFLAISSCGSGPEKATDQHTAAAPAITLNTPATTAADTILDPDPTDSIPASAYIVNSASPQTAGIVRLALKDQFRADLGKNLIDSASRKFIFFEYDLNGDGKNEIFVGLTGPYFCGSGGCSILLLDNHGNLVTGFTVARYPVIIDKVKTNGWNDLFIHSGGKDRIIKFDGKKYPSNPSNQPALKVIPGDGLTRALNFINEPYPWFVF
jgi:hypothetical protein